MKLNPSLLGFSGMFLGRVQAGIIVGKRVNWKIKKSAFKNAKSW